MTIVHSKLNGSCQAMYSYSQKLVLYFYICLALSSLYKNKMKFSPEQEQIIAQQDSRFSNFLIKVPYKI